MKPYKKKFFTAIIISIFLLNSGCTNNPATGEKSFTGFMSKEKEAKVGKEEHPKILKQFGGEYHKSSLNAYIRFLGRKLIAVSEVPNLPFRFTILNDERVNAFALPGGYVYITRGLLALANNEAEIAGVLAHEIAHITARHTAQRYSAAIATNIGLNIFGILGSAAGLPSGVGQVVSFGASAAIQGYSRSQELQADMLGVRYMTRAGYSPEGMTSFFRVLASHSKLKAKQIGGNTQEHNIMSTHPRTQDRIIKAIKMAKSKTIKNPIYGREEYLQQINNMVFGDTLRQGIRRGNEFIHPYLGFKFSVPPSFSMLNYPDKLIAFGPKKSRIEFSMIHLKNVKSIKNLRHYLVKKWAGNLPLRNLETLNINGMVAETGTSQTIDGMFDIRLLVIKGNPKEIFRFAFINRPSQTKVLTEGLQRLSFSFKRLEPSEAKNVLPLRIQIITVKQYDTIKSFIQKMTTPNDKFNSAWFHLLNTISIENPLTIGMKVKLITQ
jgi:predicted Zn-dependent protease